MPLAGTPQGQAVPQGLASPMRLGRTVTVPTPAEEKGSDCHVLGLHMGGQQQQGAGWVRLPPSTLLPLQVEVWDGAMQPGPRSRHNLQSNTQYVFQVRCRLSAADSPWSAWSTPFLYTTPEAGKLSLGMVLAVFSQPAHQPLEVLHRDLAQAPAAGQLKLASNMCVHGMYMACVWH